MSMKALLATIIMALLIQGAIAQDLQEETAKPSNAVYGGFSFGGLIAGLSVSYEKTITEFTMGTIGLRGAYARVAGWDLRGNSLGVNWVYLYGRKKHHLELNMGMMGIQDRFNDPEMTPTERFFAQWDFFPLLNAGYRYQKPEGGFMLRTGGGMEMFFVSVGYSF